MVKDTSPFVAASSKPAVSKRLNDLLAFLKTHRAHPRAYRHRVLRKRLYLHDSAGAKLTAVFVSALTAGPGGALARPGEAAKEFADIVAPIRSERTTKADLLQAFGAADLDGLRQRLQKFPHIGAKKAALFLRDLSDSQDLDTECRIFQRRFIQVERLQIPFDAVIASALNLVLGNGTIPSRDDLNKQFEALTNWAHLVSPGDHMILEDLWYWGYFCLIGRSVSRELRLNEPKIYLDDAFAGVTRPPRHFLQFIELANQWT